MVLLLRHENLSLVPQDTVKSGYGGTHLQSQHQEAGTEASLGSLASQVSLLGRLSSSLLMANLRPHLELTET